MWWKWLWTRLKGNAGIVDSVSFFPLARSVGLSREWLAGRTGAVIHSTGNSEVRLQYELIAPHLSVVAVTMARGLLIRPRAESVGSVDLLA